VVIDHSKAIGSATKILKENHIEYDRSQDLQNEHKQQQLEKDSTITPIVTSKVPKATKVILTEAKDNTRLDKAVSKAEKKE